MPIDPARPFKPVRIAILTISDSRSSDDDTSGDKLAELLTGAAPLPAPRLMMIRHP